jgi:hypothetical protein
MPSSPRANKIRYAGKTARDGERECRRWSPVRLLRGFNRGCPRGLFCFAPTLALGTTTTTTDAARCISPFGHRAWCPKRKDHSIRAVVPAEQGPHQQPIPATQPCPTPPGPPSNHKATRE